MNSCAHANNPWAKLHEAKDEHIVIPGVELQSPGYQWNNNLIIVINFDTHPNPMVGVKVFGRENGNSIRYNR